MKHKKEFAMILGVVFTFLSLAASVTAIENSVPIGTILPYGGRVDGLTKNKLAQQGWLVCDGDSINRKEYPELFDAIGSFFGGDGNLNFNLPDFRGRFVRGVDHGAGRDPDAKNRKASNPGGNEGDKVGSVQDDAFTEHKHSLPRIVYKHGRSFKGSDDSDHTLKHCCGEEWIKETNPAGDKETRPKNIYVNFIIRAR